MKIKLADSAVIDCRKIEFAYSFAGERIEYTGLCAVIDGKPMPISDFLEKVVSITEEEV